MHNVLRRSLDLNISSNEIGEKCRPNLTLILLVRWVKKTEIGGAHETRGDYENPYKTVMEKPEGREALYEMVVREGGGDWFK